MAKKSNTTESVTLAGGIAVSEHVPAIVLAVQHLPAADKLRGARAAWYAVLAKHDGLAAADFLAATTAAPPSLPTKGKNQGKAEKPTGWLSWFMRNGYVTLESARS